MSQTQVLSPNPSITLLYEKDIQQKSENTYLREARFSFLASEIRKAQSREFPLITPPKEDWDGVDATIKLSDDLPPLHTGPVDFHKLTEIIGAQAASAMYQPDAERAFFVADLSRVYFQYQRWKNCLPGVKPFYAVKCNPDPYVLRLLAALGTGFDCASLGEISQVLGLGSVDPTRIIFANPCKALSFIRQSRNAGVDMMTFDNVDELVKIAQLHPGAALVLRILTDDSRSTCRLGLKFGASLQAVPSLLAKAKELQLNVIGISFHVGSGCYDPSAFAEAVALAKQAFMIAKDMGFEPSLLDVGGGFEDDNFESTAAILRAALLAHFTDEIRSGLEVIAEPGRFFVSKAFQLVANIIARRADNKHGDVLDCEPSRVMYYINDGVYGAFNCILFDHQKVEPHVLTLRHIPVERCDPSVTYVENASIWGPTCDSIDCVCPEILLPASLEVGDWLGFEDMGAYTICAASQFNGFERSGVVYTAGIGETGARVQTLLRMEMEKVLLK